MYSFAQTPFSRWSLYIVTGLCILQELPNGTSTDYGNNTFEIGDELVNLEDKRVIFSFQ